VRGAVPAAGPFARHFAHSISAPSLRWPRSTARPVTLPLSSREERTKPEPDGERSGRRDQPLHTPPFVPRVSCYTVNLFQFPSH